MINRGHQLETASEIPSRPRLRHPTRRLTLGFVTGALILLLFAIQLYQWQQGNVILERVERSHETRVHLDRVLSLHQDIETGQRGFVLTGNRAFLEPYLAAKASLGSALRQLINDFSNSPNQRATELIRQASRQKVAFSEQAIALRQEGGADEATALVATGKGRKSMDRIRDLVEQLRASEQEELRGLLQARSSASWWGQPLSIGVQAILLLLLSGAYFAHLTNVRRLELSNVAAQDLSARQTAIFDAASDAMLVADQAGRIETANPAALRLFGRELHQIVGEQAHVMFQDGEIILGGLNQCRSRKRPAAAVQHLQGMSLDGTSFDAEVSTSIVQLVDRVLTMIVVRDGTERNRVERMKTQFVSTVSHELRTPLTSIRGAIALLEHSIGASLDEKPRTLLAMAKSNSERLSMLIDDILDFEKLGSSELEFDKSPIDLRDVIARAEEGNNTFAADRGVRLNVILPEQPIMVIGDGSRLLQALTNLISNAAKFSPRYGVVTIIGESDFPMARMSVVDQGPGIPSELQDRLFDRFTQARHQKQGSRAGTGLGLAITKAIVGRHNGTIDFETSAGEGTRFWIELPLVEKGALQ